MSCWMYSVAAGCVRLLTCFQQHHYIVAVIMNIGNALVMKGNILTAYGVQVF